MKDEPRSVSIGDVLPSLVVYAAAISLGGYLLEEWTDRGGAFALAAGIAWVVMGGVAALWFAVRWWHVTHSAPPQLASAESTSGSA